MYQIFKKFKENSYEKWKKFFPFEKLV
jgi:hypothetical protein